MRQPLERAWYELALALGKALRATRYASVTVGEQQGRTFVRKRRSAYAPLLLRAGDILLRALRTGVRVLPRVEWLARERELYATLYGATVTSERGVVELPFLGGRTLAALLADPEVPAHRRERAVELAVVALKRLHDRGITHGDAAAENVMVDLDGDVARWFDFETAHDAAVAPARARADDLRALLASVYVRSAEEQRSRATRRAIERYGDESVARDARWILTRPMRLALPYHLGQAPLTFAEYRQLGACLAAAENGPAD